MTTPTQITPEAKELIVAAENTFNELSVNIENDHDYESVAAQLKEVKGQHKKLTDVRLGITRPMDTAKTAVMDFFRQPLKFLADAEAKLKNGMVAYQDKQEQIRLAEEERLQKIADAKQAELDAEVEKQAEMQAAFGNVEKAAEIIENKPVVVAKQSTIAPPKVSGVSVRKIWKGIVTDKTALIKAVAEGKAPEYLLDVNISALNNMVKAGKESFEMPGVKAECSSNIASR